MLYNLSAHIVKESALQKRSFLQAVPILNIWRQKCKDFSQKLVSHWNLSALRQLFSGSRVLINGLRECCARLWRTAAPTHRGQRMRLYGFCQHGEISKGIGGLQAPPCWRENNVDMQRGYERLRRGTGLKR